MVRTYLVILLYVFLPALSQAGLTVFGHLTIYPTFFGLLASEMEGMANTEFMELWEVVPFMRKLPQPCSALQYLVC